MTQPNDDAALLREHLFDGDLANVPIPRDQLSNLVPDWFPDPMPVLVYPPFRERGVQDGDSIQLNITPYHLYFGVLRELAETADGDRADLLRRLARHWNPEVAADVCAMAQQHVGSDLELALNHFELAMELDTEHYEAIQDAGMCEYALSAAADEDREERLANAEALFRRALEVRPSAGLSWWSAARVRHDRGDEAGARLLLTTFLEQHPDGGQREMVEGALEHGFEAQVLGESDSPAARMEQARRLAFGEDPVQAIELLEPLTADYPDAGDLWFVLGAAYRRRERLDDAERCLRRAARLLPGEPFVWWELSRACAANDAWRGARNAIEKALELDPGNPQFLCDLGRALLAQGDPHGAREAIHQARELVPDDPDVAEAVRELERAGAG